MKNNLLILLLAAATHSAVAQTAAGVSPEGRPLAETWTLEDCMRYAVLHSHVVRIKGHELSSARAERTAAVGAFLPSVSAGVGAQENFGRAIDPETNTYTDVSTFYNSYSVSASLPVFDGFARLNQLRATKAGVLLGKNELQIAQDETALAVMQAYADALYFQGAAAFVRAKREQSLALLRQTKTMEEMGLKSGADIAQVEAQVAADEVEMTRQENNLRNAMMTLKGKMGQSPTPSLPEREGDFIITADGFLKKATDESFCQTPSPIGEGWGGASGAFLLLDNAHLRAQMAENSLAAARSWFLPSLSLHGGLSTTYYKTIGREATPFREQWKNNAGQYVGLSLSVPIFNRLASLTNFRKQRNALAIARERQAEKEDELTRLRLQAEADCEGLVKETAQMEKKVAADSLALALTEKQYQEGLASPIDVQTTAAALLQSRAALLKTQLTWALKRKQRDYYNGKEALPPTPPHNGRGVYTKGQNETLSTNE